MVPMGYMPMPERFRDRGILEQGKPEQPIRHPSMDAGHRAKIFAPFAALRGFDQALLSKDVLYVPRLQLNEEEEAEISRRLTILHNLTYNGRMARANRPRATVTWFVPCDDPNNEAYGSRGTYTTATDIVWNVDQGTILVGKTRVNIRDVAAIEAERLFDRDWEYDAS